ncbi:hypothetical protein EV356DRAFT_528306 [Viridothelium virens]|uniref:Uncharacterized protein n=1 Tax=Viridothelium virens TaxID=1048519 RepID=A0A6A6HPM3_VIRVR|nr:hypothetical protein EV356DRAFT_528306 [Viridothelium virens]
MARSKISNKAPSRKGPGKRSTKAKSRQRNTENPSSKSSRAVGESQNTLTQLDFVHVSHLSHDENSQDEDEKMTGKEMEEDEHEEESDDYQDDDFVPKNPRKRKRGSLAVSNKRQQTLTQIDWTPRPTLGRDEEEYRLEEEEGKSPSPAVNGSYHPAYSKSDKPAETISNRSRQGIHASSASSMTENRSLQHHTSRRSNEGFSRPALQDPSTPKTVRAQTVPSSQTPEPTPFSTRSTRHSKTRFLRSVTRSPLTELSSNRRSVIVHPPESPLEKLPSTAKSLKPPPDATPSPRKKNTFASRLIYDSEADSPDDDDEEEEEATTFNEPTSRQGLGVHEAAMVWDESQELPRLRTDSEEISSQINRELLFFTQPQCQGLEQPQNDGHCTTKHPGGATDGQNEGEIDHRSPQEVRQSQVSTVDVTQDPHSSNSRHLSSLPPVASSSPNLPRLRESPIYVASSPISTGSKVTQQGAITLSQLLPESLMEFSLPPPPSSPQYDE